MLARFYPVKTAVKTCTWMMLVVADRLSRGTVPRGGNLTRPVVFPHGQSAQELGVPLLFCCSFFSCSEARLLRTKMVHLRHNKSLNRRFPPGPTPETAPHPASQQTLHRGPLQGTIQHNLNRTVFLSRAIQNIQARSVMRPTPRWRNLKAQSIHSQN